VLVEAFVPVYRCGAVLDSHQIPCCHTRLRGHTNSTREDNMAFIAEAAAASSYPVSPTPRVPAQG
jgi:hypothetical protein